MRQTGEWEDGREWGREIKTLHPPNPSPPPLPLQISPAASAQKNKKKTKKNTNMWHPPPPTYGPYGTYATYIQATMPASAHSLTHLPCLAWPCPARLAVPCPYLSVRPSNRRRTARHPPRKRIFAPSAFRLRLRLAWGREGRERTPETNRACGGMARGEVSAAGWLRPQWLRRRFPPDFLGEAVDGVTCWPVPRLPPGQRTRHDKTRQEQRRGERKKKNRHTFRVPPRSKRSSRDRESARRSKSKKESPMLDRYSMYSRVNQPH